MTESTITAKGQTTVPADIRQMIGGVPGTRLVWHCARRDETAVIQPE